MQKPPNIVLKHGRKQDSNNISHMLVSSTKDSSTVEEQTIEKAATQTTEAVPKKSMLHPLSYHSLFKISFDTTYEYSVSDICGSFCFVFVTEIYFAMCIVMRPSLDEETFHCQMFLLLRMPFQLKCLLFLLIHSHS